MKDLLLRLASNNGHKFKLNDSKTWSQADEILEVEHPKLARVKLSRWSGYHFRQSAEHPMEIIRVEVLEPIGTRRKFKPLWLAGLGETLPPLESLWLKYLRRFGVEHWYRFAQQRLYWTHPQLSSTQASERWSDLMVLLSWQLWFAPKRVH